MRPEWNRKLELACERLDRLRDTIDDDTVSGIASIVLSVLDSFMDLEAKPTKEPGPAKTQIQSGVMQAKQPAPPSVRNPEGKVWRRTDFRIHLEHARCQRNKRCRNLTPAEAFRPGAVAEWTNPDDPILSVRGYVRSVIEVDGGRTLLNHTWRETKDLRLITPAPEGE